MDTIGKSEILPSDIDDVCLLLDVAVIQKAAYEVRYEIGHRPDWVGIPFRALQRIIGTT
jgi:maltose alpha-D-glucosyltransferase/alpha-amylase